MARKVVVSLIDDLDGSVANETVEFALDGVSYEIDLSSGNAKNLRASVATYAAVARRPDLGSPVDATPEASLAAGATAGPKSRDRKENRSVRQWARQQGLTPCDRGRIPTAMLDFYASRQTARRDVARAK